MIIIINIKLIIELIEKYKDNIMEYTLGNKIDEDGELYSNIYKWEWEEFKNRLETDISNLQPAEMELTPEILTYLIINEWGGVWCMEEDLNISELKKLSNKIIIDEIVEKINNNTESIKI